MDKTLNIVDGPDKPALQWAVLYIDKGQTVTFWLQDEIVEAAIDRIDELTGFDFSLAGKIVRGPFKNSEFDGRYSVATRSGSLEVRA